jgi:hypothetical protein
MKNIYGTNIAYLIKTLVVAGLAFATSAKAQIYDNLGAAVTGADVVSALGPLYDSFTSPGTAQAITSLQLALGGDNASGTLTVGLYSDSSTFPGALITTLGTINDTTISSGINDYTVSLLSNPVLAASTRYWIGLMDTDDVTWAWSLDISGPGVSGEFLANQNGVFANAGNGPYLMDLNGSNVSSVPDAGSTASILGLGFAGLMALRRKMA